MMGQQGVMMLGLKLLNQWQQTVAGIQIVLLAQLAIPIILNIETSLDSQPSRVVTAIAVGPSTALVTSAAGGVLRIYSIQISPVTGALATFSAS